MARGRGLGNAGLTDGFSANQWSNDHNPPLPATRATALNRGDYFEFTVTIKASYVASLDSLDVSMRRSGLGAPDSFEWQYSFDRFKTAGTPFGDFRYFGRASGTAPESFPSYAYTYEDVPGQNGGNPMETIDLTGVDELQQLSGGDEVTFRLYGWGADRNSRTIALGRTHGPSWAGKYSPPHLPLFAGEIAGSEIAILLRSPGIRLRVTITRFGRRSTSSSGDRPKATLQQRRLRRWPTLPRPNRTADFIMSSVPGQKRVR